MCLCKLNYFQLARTKGTKSEKGRGKGECLPLLELTWVSFLSHLGHHYEMEEEEEEGL